MAYNGYKQNQKHQKSLRQLLHIGLLLGQLCKYLANIFIIAKGILQNISLANTEIAYFSPLVFSFQKFKFCLNHDDSNYYWRSIIMVMIQETHQQIMQVFDSEISNAIQYLKFFAYFQYILTCSIFVKCLVQNLCQKMNIYKTRQFNRNMNTTHRNTHQLRQILINSFKLHKYNIQQFAAKFTVILNIQQQLTAIILDKCYTITRNYLCKYFLGITIQFTPFLNINLQSLSNQQRCYNLKIYLMFDNLFFISPYSISNQRLNQINILNQFQYINQQTHTNKSSLKKNLYLICYINHLQGYKVQFYGAFEK
ncbi:unnamed protein product [Paramecium octaurelia]|uniref:Transmembrane protein n=1 Tax=Paramecium octaurelia TaxID=43137 RepID=A0A8S1YKX3_PAROT|nr:unnamed protein product [Paramecium octaurelia]